MGQEYIASPTLAQKFLIYEDEYGCKQQDRWLDLSLRASIHVFYSMMSLSRGKDDFPSFTPLLSYIKFKSNVAPLHQ